MVHIFVVGTVFLAVLVTSLVGATDSVSSHVKTTAAFHDLEELFQIINNDNNSYLRRSGRESDRNLLGVDFSPVVCQQSESLFSGGADCTCSNISSDKVNFNCNLLDGGHTITGVVTITIATFSAAVEATACTNSSETNCVTMEAEIGIMSKSVTSTCMGATAGGDQCNSCSSCDSGGILDIAVDCDNVQEAASMDKKCTDLVSYLNYVTSTTP